MPGLFGWIMCFPWWGLRWNLNYWSFLTSDRSTDQYVWYRIVAGPKSSTSGINQKMHTHTRTQYMKTLNATLLTSNLLVHNDSNVMGETVCFTWKAKHEWNGFFTFYFFICQFPVWQLSITQSLEWEGKIKKRKNHCNQVIIMSLL